MANQQVAPVRTSFDSNQLIPAFVSAWRKLIGTEPSQQQIAMLIAHNALETGGFTTKAMFNYNIGNITKTPQDSFDFFVHPDSYHGKRFMSKFRSYNSLEDGVLDYLKLLKKGYPQAFEATSQTPKDFAHALIANPKFKYYDETHEKDYASGMTSLYNQTLKSKDFHQSFNTAITADPTSMPKPSIDSISDIETLLSKFISSLANNQNKQNKITKHAIQTYLPQHQFLIKVTAPDMTDAIEFSRILSTAIDEELMATATTFVNKNKVEVECNINGEQNLCEQALIQLCEAMSFTFEKATNKVGGIQVFTHILPNRTSNYQQLDIKLAAIQYDLFHDKITKAYYGK